MVALAIHLEQSVSEPLRLRHSLPKLFQKALINFRVGNYFRSKDALFSLGFIADEIGCLLSSII